MQWRGRRQSSNIEDRRGGGGGMARPAGFGGIGLLIVVLLGLFFGVDLTPLMQGGGGMVTTEAPSGPNEIDDETEDFVSVVLAENEDIWGQLFRQSNLQYTEPRLVLFTGATSSGCGFAQSAMGPFYCPNDQTVFLDMDFFRVMEQQLGSRGDFAKAYVIAHEVGHHVQDELGLLAQVHAQRGRVGERQSNEISVRTELQADCYSRGLGQLGARPAPAYRGRHQERPRHRGPHRRRRPAAREPGPRQCPTASPTARASSARPGSTAASSPVTRARATPSRQGGCDGHRHQPPHRPQAARTRGRAPQGRRRRGPDRHDRRRGRAPADRGRARHPALSTHTAATSAGPWLDGRPEKHSLTLRGHRTSVSLEPEFWRAFRAIAAAEGRPLNALAAEIDAARPAGQGLASRSA